MPWSTIHNNHYSTQWTRIQHTAQTHWIWAFSAFLHVHFTFFYIDWTCKTSQQNIHSNTSKHCASHVKMPVFIIEAPKCQHLKAGIPAHYLKDLPCTISRGTIPVSTYCFQLMNASGKKTYHCFIFFILPFFIFFRFYS